VAAIAFVGGKRVLKIYTPSLPRKSPSRSILARARFSERPCAVNNRRENLDVLWCQNIHTPLQQERRSCLQQEVYDIVSFDSILVEGTAVSFGEVVVVVVAAIAARDATAKAVLHITSGLTKLPSTLLRSTHEDISQKCVRSIYEKVTNAGTHTRRAPGTG
jgi:hypothetical protein